MSDIKIISPAVFDSFQESDRIIRSSWALETGHNKRSMLIGWHGYRIKKADKFTQHGYSDESAYRDAVGVSQRCWGRMIRIAGAFDGISQDDFIAMTAENAELLSTLPESYRSSLAWLDLAKSLKSEDFKRHVLIEKAAINGTAVEELRVQFKMKVFERQREVISAAVADFKREHGLIDDGTALEWMVMEAVGRNTFAKFIREQLFHLKSAVREEEDPGAVLGNHIVALANLLQNFKTKGGS